MATKSKLAAAKKAQWLVPAPKVVWTETDDGFVPVIFVANKVFELESRPLEEFAHKERDLILIWVNNFIAESLFGIPVRLFNDNGASARNPNWDLLPYIKFEDDPREFTLVNPKPSMTQEHAASQLVIGSKGDTGDS